MVNYDTVRNSEQLQHRYYFYDAKLSNSREDYAKVMADYLFLSSLTDTIAAVQYNLGLMYQGLQRTDLATQHYARAFALEPQSYWSGYASMLYNDGKKQEAIKTLEQAHKLKPADTDIITALEASYAASGDIKKALRMCDRLEAIEGINIYSTTTRYNLYLSAGQTDKAIQAIERYLRDNSDDIRYRVFLADLYLATGKREQALSIYRQLQEEHPDNPYVWLSLAQLSESENDAHRAALYTERALSSELMDLTEKLQLFTKYSERLSRVDSLPEKVINSIVNDYPQEERAYQAAFHFFSDKNDIVHAKQALESQLIINPDNELTYTQLLNLFQNDSTTSDEQFYALIDNAYQRFPNNLMWVYYKAQTYIIAEQNDSAINFAQTALKQPSDGQNARYRLALWIMLGDLYTLKEEIDSTFLAYDEALRMDPQNIYVLNNYAYIMAINGGDLHRAEQMSRKTIEKEPDNATFLDTYAWIMHLQGQKLLAQFYIKKALENIGAEQSQEIKEHYNIIFEQ